MPVRSPGRRPATLELGLLVAVMDGTNPFRVTPNGSLMERRGPAWNEERRRCQKKLCFVATDQALLAEILDQLAERPDCFYVRYSVRLGDGM
jgi:hypothetical protein